MLFYSCHQNGVELETATAAAAALLHSNVSRQVIVLVLHYHFQLVVIAEKLSHEEAENGGFAFFHIAKEIIALNLDELLQVDGSRSHLDLISESCKLCD